MRMCFPSASRQPCSIGSCIVVTRKRPSGLTVAPRCEPFHSSFSGDRLRSVRKPKCGAVVVSNGEAKSLRQKGEPADGRRRLEFAQLFGLHERRLASRPGNSAVRPDGDVIDPAMFRIGRQLARFTLRVRRRYRAVIAAADDALAISSCCKNCPAMDGHAARLRFGLDQQKRFLAQDEHRGAPEKMRANDSAACGPPRVCVRRLRRCCCEGRSSGVARGNQVHAMQPANPSRIFSSGRLRPMKTMRLSRFSSGFHGR